MAGVVLTLSLRLVHPAGSGLHPALLIFMCWCSVSGVRAEKEGVGHSVLSDDGSSFSLLRTPENHFCCVFFFLIPSPRTSLVAAKLFFCAFFGCLAAGFPINSLRRVRRRC